MPGFDGRGPTGKGPLTGRGLGACRNSLRRFAGRNGGKRMLLISTLPIAGAVLNDIRKPDGLVRRCAGAIGRRLKGVSGRRINAAWKKLDDDS